MKKIILSILLSLLCLTYVCAGSRNKDKIIASGKQDMGLIYTLYEERDGEVYFIIESNNEKDKLKVEADTIEEAKIMFEQLEDELLSYSKDPIKSFIKDNKKWGEYDRDDETRIKYFEIDDDFFDFPSYYDTEDYEDFFD